MKHKIQEAAAFLRAGKLVAFPTETVYGLGADALNVEAIARIFTVKERPFHHPLIVHLHEVAQLSAWAVNIPEDAWRLAAHFWPGPLTLVLPKAPHVPRIVTGEQETIGLRIPSHPIALALLREFGGGIAAPSANRFTHISPTDASAVIEELGGKVDMILDGGASKVGLESTIIDMTGETPTILRPGMVTAEMLQTILQKKVENKVVASSQRTVRAPGTHHLHYAPTTKTLRVNSESLLDAIHSLSKALLPAAVVLHSAMQMPMRDGIKVVQLADNPEQYAHDLYHTLRELDRQSFQCIIMENVPTTDDWQAIYDRIFKATGSADE